jgi:hypothetical protein
MSTDLLVDEFTIQLKMFKEIISDYPEIEKVRAKLESLKDKSANSNELTFWQKDAIIGRVKNYLAGQYGEQIKKTDNRSEYSKNLK